MNNGCRDFYLGIYGGLGLMQAFSILILSVTLSITTLAGSRKLHRVLLDRVLKSPMGFFDTTPLGRIVNRYYSTVELGDTLWLRQNIIIPQKCGGIA